MKKQGSDQAVRLYRLLLRFYPKGFRDKYAEQMALDFRELYENHRQPSLVFWTRLLTDFATSLVTQVLNTTAKPMKTTAAFASSFIISLLIVTIGHWAQPRIYTSKALVEITAPSIQESDSSSPTEGWLKAAYESLELGERWGEKALPIREDEGLSRLRESVQFSPIRLTNLMSIRVSDSDPQLAAQIANDIARQVTTRSEEEAGKRRIFELATPPTKPSSPNTPQWAMAGLLICLLGSASIARLTNTNRSCQ